MSADLYTNAAGIVSMGYRGESPWHKTGQVILDTDTYEDIVKKCGFDFTIDNSPVEFIGSDGENHVMKNRVVLHRNDTNAPLAVVSDQYKVHQPSEILGFFGDFAQKHGFKIETAGVLGNGEKYWALARTPVEGDAGNGKPDHHLLYALLATSCDGTMVTRALATSVRVVCANTLQVAVANGKAKGTKQSHRSRFSAKKAAEAMGFSIEEEAKGFESMIQTLRAMNKETVDAETARAWFSDLLRPKAERDAAAREELQATSFADLLSGRAKVLSRTVETDRDPRGLAGLLEAYESAPGAKPGTVRGLVEATTYFVDHVRGRSDDGRRNSAWFGQGSQLKARAWQNATALL